MWIAISGERVMSLGRFLGTLGTLLFAGAFLARLGLKTNLSQGRHIRLGQTSSFSGAIPAQAARVAHSVAWEGEGPAERAT